MQIGFNTDVEFEGDRYHIQTEDHGLKDGRITSQIFREGAIVDTITVSYLSHIEEIEESEARDEAIRKRMRALHKLSYRNIQSGKYADPLAGADTDEMPDRSEALAAAAAVSLAEVEPETTSVARGGDADAVTEGHETRDPTHPMEASPALNEEDSAPVPAATPPPIPTDTASPLEVPRPTPPPPPRPSAQSLSVPVAARADAGAVATESLDAGGAVSPAGDEDEAGMAGTSLTDLEELELEELSDSGLIPIEDDLVDSAIPVDIQLAAGVRAFRGLDVDPDRELTTLIELWARRLSE